MLEVRAHRPKLLVMGLAGAAIFAMTLGTAWADTIVHSFFSQGNLQPGWVVALSKSSNDTVIAAPANDTNRIYGVVIDPNSAPLTVQKQNEQIFVTNSGNYPVLVSTQNGAIKSGDYISLSQTDGIGAKATNKQDFILGRALEGFSGGSAAIVYANDGSALGRISVQIAPTKNPLIKDTAGVPTPLRNLGETVAGKPVAVLRIYAALSVILISALISAILLWGGIRSAMISIGRNPLSKHSIMRSLTQVAAASALVLVIGLFGVYLLLKI